MGKYENVMGTREAGRYTIESVKGARGSVRNGRDVILGTQAIGHRF